MAKMAKIDNLIWAIIVYTFVLFWVYGSYFKGDPYSYISFAGADGWCDPMSEALGVHCFGDYSAIRFTGFLDQVSGPESVYLPMSRIATLFISIPISFLGFRFGISLSAVLIYVAIVWGTIRSTRSKISPMMRLYLSLSLPIVVAVDRLNTIWLAYLLLLVAIATFKRAYIPIVLVLLSALVKPIFLLFLYPFLPIIVKKYGLRVSLLNLVAIIYLYLLAILLWLKAVNFSSGWTFSFFVQSVRNWSTFHAGSVTPADLSFGSHAILGQNLRTISLIVLLVVALVDLIADFRYQSNAPVSQKVPEKSDFRKFHIRILITGCIVIAVQSPFWAYNLLVFLPTMTWLYQEEATERALRTNKGSQGNDLIRVGILRDLLREDKLQKVLLILLICLVAPLFIPSRFKVGEGYTPVMTNVDTLYNWYDLNIRLYIPIIVAMISTKLLIFDRGMVRIHRAPSKLS